MRVHVWMWRDAVSPAAAATAPARTEAPVAAERPAIAMLPFDNMVDDPEQGFFADGMCADIVTALSRFRSLYVTARNSTFSFKG